MLGKVKHFAVGVAMTLLTVAVGFYLIKRFAPPQVQELFKV